MSVPQIYCINLKTSTDRRQRMEKRFAFCKLTDHVTYINAVHKSKPIIEYYHQEVTKKPHHTEDRWRSEMGCFASHLKAIRTFLEDGGEECIICEDDILLRNNFIEEYKKTRKNFPKDAFIVSFSYMIETWDGSKTVKDNVKSVNHEKLWGTQMYWLTKDYAIHCLEEYDRQYKFLKAENIVHTSEVIVREKGVLVVKPPLCIEEGCDSLRKTEDMPYHHNHFMQWGYGNYSDCEEGEHVSPMANPTYKPKI